MNNNYNSVINFNSPKQTMKTEDTLYIRILIWAYNKREAGFIEKDLFQEFGLDTEQIKWYLKIFRSNLPISENLVGSLDYADNKHTMTLTAKGTSEAIAYLGLEEARKSGVRAERIAKWAIVIGIIVGLVQIVISLFQIYLPILQIGKTYERITGSQYDKL